MATAVTATNAAPTPKRIRKHGNGPDIFQFIDDSSADESHCIMPIETGSLENLEV